jgi:Tol biopolymer transport system component
LLAAGILIALVLFGGFLFLRGRNEAAQAGATAVALQTQQSVTALPPPSIAPTAVEEEAPTLLPSLTPIVTVAPTLAATATSAPTVVETTPAAVGGEIVFQSERDGNSEIYIADADGSNQRPLTLNSANDRFPRVSPDGRRVVFVSDRDGNFEIYVMNRDGSGQTRLTFEAAEDRLPAWSPDGRQITFQSARFGIPDVFIMDADGSNLRQVTYTPEREGHTSWSVKDELVFNASLELFWQIYVSDVNGDDQQRLTNSRIDEWSPEWSSDGRRILFLSERESSINSGIYIMNADGTNVQLLYNSPQEEWAAVWAAGDSQILFTVDQADGIADIYIMDSDGSNVRRLIEQGSYPSWAAP